jgi:hypothetical protein
VPQDEAHDALSPGKRLGAQLANTAAPWTGHDSDSAAQHPLLHSGVTGDASMLRRKALTGPTPECFAGAMTTFGTAVRRQFVVLGLLGLATSSGLAAAVMSDGGTPLPPVATFRAEVSEPGAATLSVTVAPPATIGTCPIGEDADCYAMVSVLRLSVTIKALGVSKRCAKSCRVPIGHSLLLRPDDTYAIPGGIEVACADSSVTLPIGSGRIEPRRRGRKRSLIPDDAAVVDRAVSACLGPTKTPFAFWVRPSRDGSTIRGKATMRGRQSLGVGQATLSAKLKQKGGPLGAPTPATLGRKLGECGQVVELRCRLVL